MKKPGSFTLALCFSTALLATIADAASHNPPMAIRFAKPDEALVAREETFWRRIPLPVPDHIVLETSGILPLAGRRLLVTTRRGELWFIEGAYDENPHPRYKLFAEGLHEPLGIAAGPNESYYVVQRQELTRIIDRDRDGEADVFETVCTIPISGSFHEYAFGPVMGRSGNLRLTLNVAAGGGPTQAPVPWRGWMLEVTPDGQMIPVATGLRAPCGFTMTSSGEWFVADNQGPWIGSGRITHIESGDFAGHPAGLDWSRLPGSTVSLRPGQIQSFAEPMHDVAKRIPGVKTPAVWLPHAIHGISTAGIQEDQSGGKFGPFAGQLFVGDQGQSRLMRVSLEKVRGVWQGASYAFRSGFDCGIIRVAQGDDGSLFTGETERGWGSLGPKKFGLERLVWTGGMPFEIREVRAEPDGFTLHFTVPVDRATAESPDSFSVAGFTYLWHKDYGSPPVNRLDCPVRKIVVAPDGLSIRLALGCLREGYIHEITAAGLRAAKEGSPLLHHTAYYTLNRMPAGDRIVPIDPRDAEVCGPGSRIATTVNPAVTKKRPTAPPPEWNGAAFEETLLIGTQPGLKFDTPLITVKAGTRLRLVFSNSDEMLHNLVVCAPGQGQAVGAAGLALGLDGATVGYVPASDDVLVHTALLAPQASDTLYFTAPTVAGDYDFVCTFPGHAPVMTGILRVESR